MSEVFTPHGQFPQFDRNAYANAWQSFRDYETSERRRLAGNACMTRCIELTESIPEALEMFRQVMEAAENDES